MRATGSVLSSAPWRRAPVLLLRTSPGAFVACALAALVLAAAAASGPLFLASTATAALHDGAARSCPQDAQPAITDDSGPAAYPTATERPARLSLADARVRTAMWRAGLPAAQRVSTAYVGVAGGAQAFLYARAGAAAHVRVLASRPGPGLLVPRSFARARGLEPGDRLAVGGAHPLVVGIYRDLAPSAFVPLFQLPRYWCAWSDEIVPTPENRPPPMFLTDAATLRHTAQVVMSTWYDPTPVARRTISSASAALHQLRRAEAALGDHAFHLQTQLAGLLDQADRVEAGLHGPVTPISVAGALIAGLLVAAAGLFWTARRARETRLLRARGVAAPLVGIKAALEAAPAIVVGALLGWLLAIGLVRGLGPSSLLEPGAPQQALTTAAVSAGAAIGALGITVALAVAERSPGRRRWVRRVPWEAAAIALALASYVAERRRGAVHVVHGTVQIDGWITAFPLLLLAAAAVLVGRGGHWSATRLRSRGDRLPTAALLAVRRIARSPAVLLGALVGITLPVSLLIYAAALTNGTSADVLAKYRTNIGAPIAFGILTHGLPVAAPPGATLVARIDEVRFGGQPVEVEGVDPATFARVAYGGRSLGSVVTALRPDGGSVPAVVVGGSADASALRIGPTTLPVRVVGHLPLFPGLRNPYEPMIVVDRDRLPPAGPLIDRSDELWTSRPGVARALVGLRAQGAEASYQISSTTYLDNTGLRPVTWVFAYLRALAGLAGLTAAAGVALALTTRTRRSVHAYHLLRRMGLTRSSHARSLGLEISGIAVVAWAAALGAASAAVALVATLLDPYPASPPPPAFPDVVTPGWQALAALGVLVAVAVVGLQRIVDRAPPATSLRA